MGGIAGSNQAGASIIDCATSGTCSGQHRVGGVAGENYGSLSGCANSMDVNTTYQVVKEA